MTGGKRKPLSPKQLVDDLKAKSAIDQIPEPADGTVEDEIYQLSLKVTQLTGVVGQVDKALRDMSESLQISRRQNLVAMDILCTLLNVPPEAFDIAFENVMVYENKDASNLPAHIKSRQNSLLKRFARVGIDG
jgi:hypothetical protein